MNNFKMKIEAVLEKELFTTPPLMKVAVAKLIGNKHDIPKAFSLTKNEVSTNYLKHLRRIRDLPNGEIECIVCKLETNDQTRDDEDTLKELEEKYKSSNIFQDFHVELVPSKAPRTEHQLKACSTIWPCKYAKCNYLIRCIEGTIFSREEELVLSIIVNKMTSHIKQDEHSSCGAVIFRYAKVYGVGLSSLNMVKNHPVKHAPMLAIDSVAKNAGSGHWKCDESVGDRLLESIQAELSSKDELIDHKLEDDFIPYICTNYDIFVTEEPCMMCTMGLVQSRIRRLFYITNSGIVCYPDRAIEGFLVHRDRTLNHRFEAWRVKIVDSE